MLKLNGLSKMDFASMHSHKNTVERTNVYRVSFSDYVLLNAHMKQILHFFFRPILEKRNRICEYKW